MLRIPQGRVPLMRLPGVYRPQDDTQLMRDAISAHSVPPDARVIDLCTGTGALAIHAAQCGAESVTAVDVSRRAVATARLNARLANTSIDVRRGDLTEPVAGNRYHLVVSNPPYVPAVRDRLPAAGRQRAWDAGVDGRALLDRVCAAAADLLEPGGTVLVAQSALSDVEKTLVMLEEHGLRADVRLRREIPFGPVLSSRRGMLENRGFLDAGQTTEEIVVVGGVRPA
ncbi:HemK2/MTQ2 family protein methyltransferase [Rhodococcus sp. HNM0569]|uniref:HemK2/MTQ2 family protein methyltransferase n=1 Tax=Rhodococcus sp. HNM0569 TaxID=2716340 RepID=UPI00146D9466|nr:HemK2/MTQ2 family protein methyltransferase [Rhodococcus sp. HNM0569]NLU83549.1 methyltransferase [Rhodococcus sp. HNM0569]